MKTRHCHIGLSLAVGAVAALALLLCSANVARADDITVCPPGAGVCDYDNVQAAVDAANEGDVIKVAAGVYTGTQQRPAPVGYPGPGVITQVVFVDLSVTIQGGYTVTDWTVADPVANPTTLDAKGQGRALVVAGQISPTIEGLRITGGNGYSWGCDAGGGIYVLGAAVMISGNTIFSNTASLGGGVYLKDGSAIVIDNIITNNIALSKGGGLMAYWSNITLEGNTIAFNAAQVGGGLRIEGEVNIGENDIFGNSAESCAGMWLGKASGHVIGNTIYDNIASQDGGGVCTGASLDVILRDNLIQRNVAARGGGLYLNRDRLSFEGNVVSGNSASDGGGLFVYLSDVMLVNNIIADNQANAISILASSPRLLHNTIARNEEIGINVMDYPAYPESDVVLTNTILVSHTLGITVAAGHTVTLRATMWGNETDWAGDGVIITGTHNYWGDPAFLDAVSGDYHIGLYSAARDAGVATTVVSDIDGSYRPQGAASDLGADETSGIGLVVHKSGPSWALPGSPITYWLTIENRGDMDITKTLVVTDRTPVGAYVVGQPPQAVLTWTFAPTSTIVFPPCDPPYCYPAWLVSFVVTAVKTITNSDYGARTGVLAVKGKPVVVTHILNRRIYLPVVLKQD